jgi:predicted enzyme related to lactoylglutathione lyase
MDIKLSYCTLAVHDLDKTLRFYRDVLGFEVRDDVEFEGMRWVSVSPPSQPDVQIVLEPPGVDRGASPADRQAIEDLIAKGLLGRLVFVTDDCDATFEHIEAAGADVMQEPINQPFGTTALRRHTEILPALAETADDLRALGDLGYEGEAGTITAKMPNVTDSTKRLSRTARMVLPELQPWRRLCLCARGIAPRQADRGR